MPQTAFRPFSGITSFDLLSIAALSLLLILVLLALGRGGGRSVRRLGLGLGTILLAASSGLFLVGRAAGPDRASSAIPQAPGSNGGEGLYASDGKHFRHPRALYGADVVRAQLQDARLVYGDFLARAQLAELATFPGGESVLVARFDNAADVAEAARAYLQHFRVEMASGDLTQGLRGQRGDLSDRVEILLDGEMLVVWTARSEAALAARRWASEAGAGQNRHGNPGGNK